MASQAYLLRIAGEDDHPIELDQAHLDLLLGLGEPPADEPADATVLFATLECAGALEYRGAPADPAWAEDALARGLTRLLSRAFQEGPQ